MASTPDNLEAIAWVIAGLLGLVLTVAWEIFGLTDRLQALLGSSVKPTRVAVPSSAPAFKYSREKIEALRRAADGLKDVCWGNAMIEGQKRI